MRARHRLRRSHDGDVCVFASSSRQKMAAVPESGDKRESDGRGFDRGVHLAETLGFYEAKEEPNKDAGQNRNLSDLSLLRFISAELTRGYLLEHNEAKYKERREKVYTCLRIPRELEKLVTVKEIPTFSKCPYLVAVLHTILVMVQATTLNVAFNSHNKSLLTIMMSNNFVEIKGSVFKKFEKNNLFQMSNSDIRERFNNYVLLLIVCLRNMEQFSWNPDHLWVLFPDVCMVIASEIAVDVVKHAFITKFNDITADVYSEYRASLAFDLVSSRQKNAYTDYSDTVSRRMGFIPLPLAVLLSRVITSSTKIEGALAVVSLLVFYFGLIALKVLNSIVLLGKSCQYVKEANMEEKLFQTPPASTPGKSGKKSVSKVKSPQGTATEEMESKSIISQPVSLSESISTLVSSNSTDQFLTTPDVEDKGVPQEKSDGKHSSSKGDLLEIDRFTICGNRID
ncbi:LOW QUALITY PROTEIN: transmembrane anterior posterior transformation protein 1 homolog [Rhincodon typus]|uniref:LOW QUALITY PROTEIN: transmembrane anterior posterior transformation protein 1 homolog n=1 Tax=Rhincodon typus TaxID=259920 RepID=UPI00202F8274|nr:LOW QUALITY PROTEIN: transmembrane anterior posterior transformation protein 1 homolog [Rhincodon typus]